jgi:hypothetical protein
VAFGIVSVMVIGAVAVEGFVVAVIVWVVGVFPGVVVGGVSDSVLIRDVVEEHAERKSDTAISSSTITRVIRISFLLPLKY